MEVLAAFFMSDLDPSLGDCGLTVTPTQLVFSHRKDKGQAELFTQECSFFFFKKPLFSC